MGKIELFVGLEFIQDNVLNCKVIKIYDERVRTRKSFKKVKKVEISRNGKKIIYDKECFEKSFNASLGLSFKLIKKIT